ncbi:MAG: prohibitin family protein [Ignavibacteria bacterium]|nr:prohibitin family protein [Ignavibacteria bacterium]
MIFIIALIVLIAVIYYSIKIKNTGRRQESLILSIAGLIALVILIFNLFTVIPAGNVGVVDFLGNVSDKTLRPGVNLVNPLANIVKYSYKTQTFKENMNVVSKEGLPIQLEVNLQFRLDPSKANEIYKSVEGGDYLNVILIPQFRSTAREVTAKYEAKALYTELRSQLASEILDKLQKSVSSRGVYVESVPLRQIILPPGLAKAIEQKLEADQESQRMEFILLKEKQEADRKRIEAQGIADFQDIVSKGISDQLLKWKGIEATEKLANSPNSKIIVVGSGKDGLPIILGN